MPIYEYHCKDCGYYFDVKATIKEKEEGLKIPCEQCGSENLNQVFGGFAILGGQAVNVKSRDSQNGGGCCGGNSSCCS
ncbi:MAG: zinc ribbon domain-containing protein [Bacteroidetes bacterium]|nr:zinc ribbon domain-containing protein [Bacteroidota bacterium]